MAHIVTDAQITAQRVFLALRPDIVLEEPKEVPLALKDTARFRFETKIDQATGLLLEAREVLAGLDEITTRFAQTFIGWGRIAPRNRQRRDAPFHAARQ